MDESYRKDISSVQNLYITLSNGTQVPLKAVADVDLIDAPMQISRENTNRRIVIGVNVGGTDIETLVRNIQLALDEKVKLPAGYYFTYGGQFENLKAANARLAIAVPLALALIFVLLYFTFGSFSQAALIFTAIPLSAIGGIWALQLRGMPFSISAGIGFIALFGVAVLNGIVLIGYFNELKKEGVSNIMERILKGASVRLRPVLMTALVASLGFLPMALSNSGGAEVQRPLATVVIGGLITATFLTLVVLPILYAWLAQWKERKEKIFRPATGIMIVLPLLFIGGSAIAQSRPVSVKEAVEIAIKNHPSIRAANLQIQQTEILQGLKYSPGKTDISYQGDGLFRENGQQINEIRAVQHFPNPAFTKAQNASQDQVVEQSKLLQQLTANQLKLEVKQLYYTLQQRKELQDLYDSLVQLYQPYYQIASMRVEAGAANNMEPLTLLSSLNEYKLMQRQVRIEIANLEKRLQGLLHTTETITTKDRLLMEKFSASDPTNSLQVRLVQQNIKMEQADIDVLKAGMKPGFNIGYAAQNYVDGGWLNGLQAGVQIPFFNQQNKKKVEAQKMQMEVAQAKYEAERLNVDLQLWSIFNSIQLYAEGADHYREQLEIVNPEMERISKLNYEAGEITYLELLNTLNLLANNNKNYWEQVLGYNKAVALYQFLSNR